MQDQPFSLVELWEIEGQPSNDNSINRECLERAEIIATNNAASTQIKASVDSIVPVGGATQ
jgi:hypothetical protein